MPKITDIKRRILELAPAPFQEFCDTLISKQGYGKVHGYGMESGTGNTTIGNPDTYFRKENGKYVFVAYTIQKTSIFSKLREDIDKCLDTSKTGLKTEDIEEIICCHISSNLSAGDDKALHDLCEAQGIVLTIWGIDELANQVHNRYRSLAKDYLGLNIDTNQILSVDDFVAQYDANGMAAPLNTVFQYRENEKEKIISALDKEPIVVVTGRAGVGKTRLVLEVIRDVALTKGYKLLCVKNNNLGLYDDLVSATEQPGKYLFFIDDANELADISQILAYTTKGHLGYEVKIIVTVRDYAKGKVISAVKEYAFPQTVEIPAFTDDEIRGFLNNLEIYNEDYVKQIIRIAEGNPRIAYMAGKLAIEKQNLTAIKDVSQLYDAYYEKYVSGSLGIDKDLCFTAGVLSIINAVVLNNMSALQDLLDYYGITSENFKEKILCLSKLEVVEIQLDQVATLSDQCLANYMLYYVFFEKKLIPLSGVLETGYKCFRNGVMKSICTILNLFESSETRAYCKQEILKVWDNLKASRDTCYNDFVKDFHVFRPEEAFLLAQEIIESINSEEFNACIVDFSRNIFCYDESVLGYLEGYEGSDYLQYVIEMLLQYCSKTAETLVSGYKWLENSYGIDRSSYKYEYWSQKKVSDYIFSEVLEGNATAMAVGFQWATYLLGFSFRHTEMERGHKLVFYHMDIKQSDGVIAYRSTCWKILIALASDRDWDDRVLLFLDSYAGHLHGKPDYDIVSWEVEYIEQLLSILRCDRICYLKTVQRLLTNGKKMNVEYDKKWAKLLTTDEWELYQILENDYLSSGLKYEEYESKRNALLSEYGRNIVMSDIPSLIQKMNNIVSDISEKHGIYSINEGFELIIQQFDEACMREFMGAFIQYGGNISIHPKLVLEVLNQSMDSGQLLSYLKQADFPQKNEWLFSFFETLPDERVVPEMLQELLDFLNSDSDQSIQSSTYRRLRFLDKFLNIEPDIYPIACAIIYGKRNYSPYIVGIYFELLFHDQVYTPREVLELFKSNKGLLQEIYFYMLKESRLEDLKGVFLIEFLSLGESWIQEYSKVFWERAEKHVDFDYHRNGVLWKSENYKQYFDYIFYHFPGGEMYSWKIKYAFMNVLAQAENDAIIKEHQREWLSHIIIENLSSDKIVNIFELVCELDEDMRRNAIKVFLDNNQDYKTFSKLRLIPNHWSGSGSLVPAYQKQIDFLESLYPLVPGVKFLKHRARIASKVEMLHEMIRREEVEAICRNLYM